MSHDVVSDALNQIMNARKAGKHSVSVKHHSKFLMNVLAMGKLKGYIKEYSIDNGLLNIEIGNLHFCKAIKPRYLVKVIAIDKYVRRYLPARGMGILVISTNKGIVSHQTAIDKKLGGSLIAYFY